MIRAAGSRRPRGQAVRGERRCSPLPSNPARGRCPLAVHDVKQPEVRIVKRQATPSFRDSHPLVPAAQSRPGFANFSHPERGGRSADRRPVLARHRWPAASHKHRGLRHAAGRGACEAPRRPLRSGRRASRRSFPWRFSASVPRFRPRHFLRSTCSQLLAARVVVPGERFPSLPGPRLRAAAAERHVPLRLQARL